jgi:hypothetical protein
MERSHAGQNQGRSHLFTVRLWRESLGNGESEVRGRVQHVLSGERRSFRDWQTLLFYLEEKLRELEQEGTA